MAESVADDPKLAALWDAGQNPQQARNDDFASAHVGHASSASMRVIACDIAHVPLEDDTLDLAIFCLSLMGSNFTDYIREAHRCLHIDGHLHVWEAASYFDDVKKFAAALAKLGFDVTTPSIERRVRPDPRVQERQEARREVGAAVPWSGEGGVIDGQAASAEDRRWPPRCAGRQGRGCRIAWTRSSQFQVREGARPEGSGG